MDMIFLRDGIVRTTFQASGRVIKNSCSRSDVVVMEKRKRGREGKMEGGQKRCQAAGRNADLPGVLISCTEPGGGGSGKEEATGGISEWLANPHGGESSKGKVVARNVDERQRADAGKRKDTPALCGQFWKGGWRGSASPVLLLRAGGLILITVAGHLLARRFTRAAEHTTGRGLKLLAS